MSTDAGAPRLPDGSGPTPAESKAMDAAAAKARTSGKPVTVDALTTPTWLIQALPKGGFQAAGNPYPVRAQQPGGAWAPVDLSLHKNADGTYTAANTAYAEVSFGAAGSRTLATTTTPGGGSYTQSWPTPLPTPVADGQTLTYPGVLPGVDLLVAANSAGGFSDTLLIHDATAAANPALAHLVLGEHATGHADARKGTLATAADGTTLSISGALIWDSATAPADAKADAKKLAASDPSDARAPGSAAHISHLGLTTTGSSLTLSPDSGLLHGKDTVFPVYVDPTYAWHQASGGTPAFDEVKQGGSCAGVSAYDNTGYAGDYGQLGVGYTSSGYPNYASCPGNNRAYYQWSLPNVLNQAHVSGASVGVKEVWQASFSCTYSHTINLHWTSGIGSSTSYNTFGNGGGYLSGADYYDKAASIGSAYNSSGCSNPSSSSAGFDVTGPLQISANNNASQITFAVANDSDEANYNGTGFARYSDNPTLQFNYGHTPTAPAANQLSASAGSTDVAACDTATAAPYPYIGKAIASNNITLTAANLNSPDNDPLQASFKYWLTATPGTTYTATSAFGATNGQPASVQLPASFTNALTNGQNVSWQVQTTNLAWPSAWSPVCTFTAEPTAPDAPAIAANSTYPANTTGAHAGTPATFQITGNAGGAPATKFYYSLDQAPTTSGTPAGQIARPLGTDTTGIANWWKLTDGTGTTAANTTTSANTATLSSGGATWTADSTRTEALALNGSSGSLTLPQNIVNGATALTVHLWFKTTGNGILFSTGHSAIGSSNPDGGSMPVLYVGSNGKLYGEFWTGTINQVITAATVNDGVWHQVDLVGAPGSETMYVDGTSAGSISGTMANIDPLDFAGAGYVNGNGFPSLPLNTFDYFNGTVSDVQTYPAALSAAQVSAMFSTNNAAVTVTPNAPGPHTLYVDAVDAAGDVSSSASYPLIAGMHANTTCPSLAACLNNTAISPDNNPAFGNADGGGRSISATDLANAGWTSGGKVTVDGASLTLPTYSTSSAIPDNVVAQNQTIAYNYAVPATGASSLMMLTTGTYGFWGSPGQIQGSPGTLQGNTTAPFVPAGVGIAWQNCFNGTASNGPCVPSGVITYAPGCGAATNNNQTYYLAVPDWVRGPGALAAMILPHRNLSNGQEASSPKIYPFAIPLLPGCTVQSITLPDTGYDAATNSSEIHLFSLGTRNTTIGTVEAGGTTAAADSGKTWTGAWASDNEGSYNFQSGNFTNQSFRVLVQPSVTGNVLRVKLDNALGTSVLNIGHATVALAAGTATNASAATAGTPVNLTFNGSQSTTIAEGGMVFSDPLGFTVNAGQWLDVSFDLTNSVPTLVEHSWADGAYEYAAPANSGDHTADTAATSYVATGDVNGAFTNLVTGLDVETAGLPTQVVLGDNLIDAWQPNADPIDPLHGGATRVGDDLADAAPSTPQPWGTVNAGIESNFITLDNPETHSGGTVGGPSAASRIDRDVLDEPGLSTVVLDEGLEDALTSPTTGLTTSALENALSGIIGELAATPTSTSGSVNTIEMGLTPCGTYGGSGGTGTAANDQCNAAVEAVRTAVNYDMTNGFSTGLAYYTTPSLYVVNPDPVIGVAGSNPVQIATAAQIGTSRGNTTPDPVNLTNAGMGALTNAVLAAQDTWTLNDGTGGNPATTGADNGAGNPNAYLAATAPNAGNSTLTLNGTEGTNYTWPTATVGTAANTTVLGLDGTTGYGATSGRVLTTTQSFSVSAWVDLTSTAHNAAAVAQDSTNNSGFYLGEYGGTWAFWFTTNDTTSPGTQTMATKTGATTGWHHLTGVYNAGAHTAQLYVDGTLAGTATGVTAWSAAGPLTVGRDMYAGSLTDYFPGDISDVQAWNYALTAPQVTALYDQIN